MAWATSDRRTRLPSNWAAIRRQVKARANGLCEAGTHVAACNGTGTDADHIVAGDNHHLDNLQWLSSACHTAKTAAETAARNTAQAALKLRPTEPHPGRRAT
jgi:5-methylcytosine-specific restriction endonuclease McrA